MTGDRACPEPKATFEEFFGDKFGLLMSVALFSGVDDALCEDAVADAFLEAYRSWDKIRYPWAWVVKVMQRRLRALDKQNRLRRDKEEKWQVTLPTSLSPEAQGEIALVLQRVGQLPLRQRQVVVLHCVLDLKQDEVAEILGIRRGTVAACLREARRALRRYFGEPPTPSRPGDRFAPARAEAQADPVAQRIRAAARALALGFPADGPTGSRVRGLIEERIEGKAR